LADVSDVSCVLVSRSGYDAWQRRPVSAQEQQRTEVISELHRIHDDRDLHVYGSARAYRELLKRGYEICENTVARLMNSAGIRSPKSKNFSEVRRNGFRTTSSERAGDRVEMHCTL